MKIIKGTNSEANLRMIISGGGPVFKRGELYVITGPNGSGKTRLASALLLACSVKNRKPAAYMSMGENKSAVFKRLVSLLSGINPPIENRTLTKTENMRLSKSFAVTAKAHIYVSDLFPRTLSGLKAELLDFAAKHRPGLMVLDGRPRSCRSPVSPYLYQALKKLAIKAAAPVIFVTPDFSIKESKSVDSIMELK